MTDNVLSALAAPIQQIAQNVAREELRQFKSQLRDVCLQAVEAAFAHHLESDRFRKLLREEIGMTTVSTSGVSKETIARLVKDAIGGSNIQGAVEACFTTHAGDFLRHSAIKPHIDALVMEKAKHIVAQSMQNRSVDLKRVVAHVVEKALAARGGVAEDRETGAASTPHAREKAGKEMEHSIQQHVRTFMASEEMKELLEQKFRAIDLYLKTDLIPKVVKREIAMTAQRTT